MCPCCHAACLAIRGGLRVESEFLHSVYTIGRDGGQQLFRQHLDCPVWTERGGEQVGNGVVGRHRGITRFVRLCHSARSSPRPLSGSNRISPLRTRPAAMGSAWRIAMILAGTLNSKIAGPPSSGRAHACSVRPFPEFPCHSTVHPRSRSRIPPPGGAARCRVLDNLGRDHSPQWPGHVGVSSRDAEWSVEDRASRGSPRLCTPVAISDVGR